MNLRNLGDLDKGGVNNFDLIRFIAATLVIFSHSFLVTNEFSKEPLHNLVSFLNFGQVSVYIFFTVSGYLITKSLFKNKNLSGFVLARVLRIFPALIFSSIITAFILGPILSTLSVKEFFSMPEVYRYGLGNSTLLDMYPYLPGVFQLNKYPLYVNSPLWTLKGEILMYGMVFLFGIAHIRATQGKAFPINYFLVTGVIVYLIALRLNINYIFNLALLWIGFFTLGALAYHFRKFIVLKISYLIIISIIVVGFIYFNNSMGKALFCIALAYGVFVLAYHPNLQLGKFSKYGDFSYGLYICIPSSTNTSIILW